MTTGEPGAPVTVVTRLPRSGVIQVDGTRCLACRECEVICSLHHHGECNPALSAVQIDADDFAIGLPDIRVCRQCDWPACLYACAAHWEDPALAIDARTGARFINADKCRGCGDCARACPLTAEHPVISRARVNGRVRYIKCDLCYDRPEGPVCVAMCPGGALTYVPAEERRR